MTCLVRQAGSLVSDEDFAYYVIFKALGRMSVSVPMENLEIRFKGGPIIRVSLRQGTPTVSALLRSLPFKSNAHTWGDEVYFDAPFHADREQDARAQMEVGDVVFWPDGDAIALFFGPTPASTDGRPRAYSPCNIIGSGVSLERLKMVTEGTPLEAVKS